jgi:hypothetical protein
LIMNAPILFLRMASSSESVFDAHNAKARRAPVAVDHLFFICLVVLQRSPADSTAQYQYAVAVSLSLLRGLA